MPSQRSNPIPEAVMREQHSHLVVEFASLVAGSHEQDLPVTLERALEVFVPAFADRAVAYQLDEEGQLRPCIARDARSEGHQRARADAGTLRRTRAAQAAIHSGESELLPEITDAFLELLAFDSRSLERVREAGIHSGVLLPLRARGRSLGVIALARSEMAPYTVDDLASFEQATALLSVAVDAAQLRVAFEQQSRSLVRAAESGARLRNVAAAILEATTTEDLSRVIVDQGFSALGASLGVIARLQQGGLRVAWAAGQPEIKGADLPVMLREPFTDVVGSGDALWFESRREFGAAYPRLASSASVPESFVAVPLRAGRHMIGVLGFGFLGPRAFGSEDRQFVLGLARQYAAALERTELIQQLEAERSSLQAVLQQMPAAVVIAEAPSGKLTLANRQVEEIWRQPFEGLDTIEVWHPWLGFRGDGQPYDPHSWPLARAIRDAEIVMGEEIEILRGDGSWGVISANAAPIRNRFGQVVAGVMAFLDVTDRRKAQQELITLNQTLEKRVEERTHELELRNAEMESFVYTASHDLRSPLLAIQSLTYLLENALNNQDEAKMRELVGRVNKRVEKMTHLLDDLLMLSRLSSQQEARESFDLQEVITSVLSDIEPQMSAAQMRVVQPKVWPKITYTRSQAYQLVMNLIVNALKYAGQPGQPPRVELSWALAAGDEQIILRVADNGPGIPLESRERVFGLFHKLNPNSNGTGVGLAIVKRIAERHGGRVWIEGPPPGASSNSTPGLPKLWGMGGATFAVTLPSAER